MKQIVKYEVFLSNSDKPFVKLEPTHVFEECFECTDKSKMKDFDDAKFNFEWKIRSFIISCKDVFKFVSVSKTVECVDYVFG